MYICKGAVALRDFCLCDIDLKLKWINDPENHKFLHYNIPLEYEKTLNWFNGRDLDRRLDCIIEFGNAPVGLIGLLEIDKINRKAEYYITIGDHRFKRKGIATMASELILQVGFEVLGLNKIYLNVDAENVGACALYEKIGMTCEGYFIEDLWHNGKLVDRKRYSMLRATYKKKYGKEELN